MAEQNDFSSRYNTVSQRVKELVNAKMINLEKIRKVRGLEKKLQREQPWKGELPINKGSKPSAQCLQKNGKLKTCHDCWLIAAVW